MKAARVVLWGNLAIRRSAIPETLADLSSWATVDKSALSPPAAAVYERQVEAIRLFVEQPDLPIADILKQTGVHREQLYRLLNRCLKTHTDGRIYGFRGAIAYAHLKEYERTQKVKPSKLQAKGGAAGALKQLLRNLPDIATWLAKEARIRDRSLKPGEMREIHKGVRSLHREFLKRLRTAGVREDEWPFNRDEQGLRSFQEYFYSGAAKALDGDEGDAAPGKVALEEPALEKQGPPAMWPFDTVQFDGHKLDIRVTLSFKDQLGLETLVELTRIWVLVCLDVVTRAVLGYSIVYATEYDSDDIARALQSCFGDHKGPTFSIPGMAIRPEGGFPNGLFEEAKYPGWRWFQFDSARANLANATLERLTDIVGCFVRSGRLGEPDDRAFMERFFAMLAKHGLHRLAGSTGSSPDDLIRELADVGSDLRLLISTDELEQVIECLLGDHNGESKTGLNGRTPLQAMRHFFAKPGGRFRQLPSIKRQQLIFLQEARLIPVRGKTNPYINFSSVRYTSDVLSTKSGLVGKKLRIYFNSQDIRHVKAFFEDGAELGTLIASRSWRRTPHSLRQRQEIQRLVRLGKLHYREGDDAIEAYVNHKRKLAKTNKRAASSLAELAKTVEMAEQYTAESRAAEVAMPASPSPPAAAAGCEPVLPPLSSQSNTGNVETRTPTLPVKPKPLSARRTFTF